jgi:assimilatory nitrate reductase catalytic subunit
MLVPTIRPDTLFIPFHYGHEWAVNQVTSPAVEPTVKIPEYKACAATLEKLDAPRSASTDLAPSRLGATANLTPERDPKLLPYTVGETKTPAVQEGKQY